MSMNRQDLRKLVEAVWDNTVPAQRMSALMSLRLGVEGADIMVFDSLVDVISSGITDKSEAITLVLVHGIRTDAAWQQLVRHELREEKHLNVIPISYGFFTALGLWGPFRNAPKRRVERELRDIRGMEPNAKLVVIAHSFGTYIMAQLLEEAPDIRYDRLLLCGAIVSRRFRWDILARDHRQGSIVNDVGSKDIFPVLAACSTLGYGSSGRHGFRTARVVDRFFNYGHSDFFCKEHIQNFWKPFVISGEIRHSSLIPGTDSYMSNLFSKGPAITLIILSCIFSAAWILSRYF